MKDTIYKEDAIEAIHREARLAGGSVAIEYADMFQDAIKALPSADRPQGEWIEDPINKNNMYCSNCKVSYTKDFLRGMSLYHEPKDMPNYCPNCGAHMKGADNE